MKLLLALIILNYSCMCIAKLELTGEHGERQYPVASFLVYFHNNMRHNNTHTLCLLHYAGVA